MHGVLQGIVAFLVAKGANTASTRVPQLVESYAPVASEKAWPDGSSATGPRCSRTSGCGSLWHLPPMAAGRRRRLNSHELASADLPREPGEVSRSPPSSK